MFAKAGNSGGHGSRTKNKPSSMICPCFSGSNIDLVFNIRFETTFMVCMLCDAAGAVEEEDASNLLTNELLIFCSILPCLHLHIVLSIYNIFLMNKLVVSFLSQQLRQGECTGFVKIIAHGRIQNSYAKDQVWHNEAIDGLAPYSRRQLVEAGDWAAGYRQFLRRPEASRSFA